MTEHTIEERTNGSQVSESGAKGRVRSTAAQREAVLEEFQRSALSRTQFAAAAGINYPTFATWLRHARPQPKAEAAETQSVGRQTKLPPNGAVHWVEAVGAMGRTREANSAVLRVHLRGGMALEISAPSQVGLAAALLRTLEGGPLSC